jgi:hypothetical protein
MQLKNKFKLIEDSYKQYYDSLLKNGKLLVRDTDTGIWGFAGSKECFEFFKIINLDKYKNFIDLGSGDGKVIAIASLFTNATGIESDKELYKESTKLIEDLSNKKAIKKERITLINKNFMLHDISKYDIVFMNPDKIFTLQFEQKLLKELKGKLFIYNKIFSPKSLERGKTLWINQMPIVSFTKL